MNELISIVGLVEVILFGMPLCAMLLLVQLILELTYIGMINFQLFYMNRWPIRLPTERCGGKVQTMAIFSKQFWKQSAGSVCADFTHPGVTCEHFAFTTFRDGWIGGSQYYLPSIVLPALLKWDKWSVPFWSDILKDYVRSIFFGASLMIFVGYGSFCCIYDFVRRHHNVFVFLPCALGSLFGYFLPPGVLEAQSIGAVNMALGHFLRSSQNPLIQFCRRSKLWNVCLFMAASGLINNIQSLGMVKKFWILKTDPRPVQTNKECVEKDNSVWMNKLLPRETKVCNHSGTCDHYILSQVRQTAGFGFLLALANFLASQGKSLKGNWGQFPVVFFKKFDFRLFFFLTSYNGIYKFLYCILNRKRNEDTIRNSTIAAALSGSTVAIYPKFLILMFGCIRSIQMGLLQLVEEHKETNPIAKKVDKMSFNWIMYTICTAYAYQARVFHPYTCPKYVHQIMTIGTGGRSDVLTENYAAILMGLR